MTLSKRKSFSSRIGRFLFRASGLVFTAFAFGTVFGAVLTLRGGYTNWVYEDAVELARRESAKPGGRNAALYYWRAWTEQDRTFEQVKANDARRHHAIDQPGADDISFLLSSDAKTLIDDLLVASAVHDCDFEVEYETGLAALLPQLRYFRGSAQLLWLDAVRCAESGDTSGTVDRIVAAMSLAEHASTDRQVIASLVAMAIVAGTCDRISDLERASDLPANEVDRIVSVVDRLSGSDFGLREAIETEGLQSSIFVSMTPVLPNGGGYLTEASYRLLGTGRDLAAQLDAMYAEILRVWGQPDALSEIERIADDAAEGAYGEVSPSSDLARSYHNAYRSMLETQERCRQLAVQLQRDIAP